MTGVSDETGACLTVDVPQAVSKTSTVAISRHHVHVTRIVYSFAACGISAGQESIKNRVRLSRFVFKRTEDMGAARSLAHELARLGSTSSHWHHKMQGS